MAKDFFYSKTQVENLFAGLKGEFENTADRAAEALAMIDEVGVVRGARVAKPQEETAWAQTTDTGHRLPLGYAPDGTLDPYARAAWLRDTEDATLTVDPIWRMVRTTPDGRIIYGERWDGSVVIPGLEGQSRQPAAILSVMDVDQTAGEFTPARADSSRVALWGSSTLANLGTTAVAWAADKGLTLWAGGKGSEWIDQTAARQGATPARLTFPGGVVPASGTVSIRTAPEGNLEGRASVMRPFPGHVTTKSGARIAGTLAPAANGAGLAFTREGAGAADPVADGVKFIPSDGVEWANATQIIQAGKNNLSNTSTAINRPEHVLEMRLKMARHQPAHMKRVLMVGDFVDVGGGASDAAARIRECNALTAAAFGPAFVDVYGWITGPQVWEDSGLTPTPEDTAAQAAGEMPPSIAKDTGHLNVTGNAAYMTLLDRHLTGLGWA